MSSPVVSIHHLDDRRGRGVVANVDFNPGDVILCVPYDMAVLYTPFVRQICHRCFEPITDATLCNTLNNTNRDNSHSQHKDTVNNDKGNNGQSTPPSKQHDEEKGAKVADGNAFMCAACEQFALCPACVRELRIEQSHPHHALTQDAETDPLLGHMLLQTHRLVCSWFCTLPESVRAGDTDYLRFALEYGARVGLGDTRCMRAISELNPNTNTQSTEACAFCASFAQKVTSTFAPLGFSVDAEHLRDVLLRTKCNSIGYPFNDHKTLGWALQEELCMLNHSCVPNAAIVRPLEKCVRTDLGNEREARRADLATAMQLVARRFIPAGKEVTIAYIDVDPVANDPRARSLCLMEKYRFLCRCEMCERQRRTG